MSEREYPLTSEPSPSVSTLPSRGGISAAVVDGLPMPIMVSRLADDRVVRLSPEFTAAYGHTTESVAGRT